MTETHSDDQTTELLMGAVPSSAPERGRSWSYTREQSERYARVSSALMAALSARTVAQVVAREAGHAVGCASAVFGLLREGGETFDVAVHTGVADDVAARWESFPNQGALPFPFVARTGEPLFLSRAEFADMFPALADGYDAHGFQASAILPLIANGRLLGALSLEFAEPNAFPDEQRRFLMTIASQTALALDRARLFEAERRARHAADLANRATTNFLAVVSHELRTPLNTISGYTDLMLAGVHGPLPERYAGYVERMRAAQKYLEGLIDNVMRYARIEAGQISYTMQTHSAADMLNALESLVEPQASARNLTVAFSTAEPALLFRADADKVIQILLNLVSNAIKYTPAPGTISVNAHCDKSAVLFRVQDSGPGIPADQLDRIFEPFVQVDPGHDHEGFGLGLAISRDLARAMGGDIEVHSTLGQGSRFTLRLRATSDGVTSRSSNPRGDSIA